MSTYRRDYKRFIANDSAYLITDNGVERLLILEDLSARGAAVVGNYPFRINEKVNVVIHAPFFFDKPALKKLRLSGAKK